MLNMYVSVGAETVTVRDALDHEADVLCESLVRHCESGGTRTQIVEAARRLVRCCDLYERARDILQPDGPVGIHSGTSSA